MQAAPLQLLSNMHRTERRAPGLPPGPWGLAPPPGFQTEPRMVSGEDQQAQGHRSTPVGLASNTSLMSLFVVCYLYLIADSFSSEILFPELRMNTENLGFSKAKEDYEPSNSY